MAGGSGTRFWPQSRENRSKQFLKILGDETLIKATVNRFRAFLKPESIYIVAKAGQQDRLRKNVPDMPPSNFIFEPEGKNTAPCIGLASLIIEEKHPGAVLIVSPSDHLIQKEKIFQRTLRAAVDLAWREKGLVTIGIQPDRPATGYGYVQIHRKIDCKDRVEAFRVKTFAEKPNFATAQRFLKCGDFLWNSGLFIFRIPSLFRAYSRFMPEMCRGLMRIRKSLGTKKKDSVIREVYAEISPQSIDYGIMEKAKNVYIVKGDFIWSDLGSWEQVYKLSEKDSDGNSVSGEAVLLDSRNCYVHNEQGLIAVLGLDDLVVVQSEGATLICSREKAEEVKQIVDMLKMKKKDQYI
jgi:mannose-1-phosphate guanylyltransferase